MDILASRVLALLQDENVRKAVDVILSAASASKTATVDLKPESEPAGPSERRPATKTVTIRRVA